jgi:tRNA A37 N6-isopentenylltransferase MiaA
MLNAGLVEEVLMLREKYRLDAACPRCAASATARSGTCWKAKMPRAELRDRGVFATRQFAKRQLTWLRSMEGLAISGHPPVDRNIHIWQQMSKNGVSCVTSTLR